jgi:hypothetical protein
MALITAQVAAALVALCDVMAEVVAAVVAFCAVDGMMKP